MLPDQEMEMDMNSQPRLHTRNTDFVWQDKTQNGALRRLTPEQLTAFDRDGFLHLAGAFAQGEVDQVISAIDPIEEAYERYVSEQQGGSFRLTETGTITFAAHLVTQSTVLRAFAAHPVIQDVCHDLIGDHVRLYWDQSVYKKTGKAQEFPWHQDNGYTFIEPQQYLTFWIPLVDVDEENGCPWIAPGLHRLGTLEHWLTPIGLKCLDEAPSAIAVPAKAGDIILFSSLAPHRTGPNLKPGSVRKAYILQYAPDGAHTFTTDGVSVAQDDPARQFAILSPG
ncbi:phytanoyl-CoA dioxygenase family protein [Sphingomonas koreensis]